MHKYSELRFANLINYMSKPWPSFAGHSFLGFVPIVGQYTNWGISLDGVDHCAVHIFRTREGFYWGDDPRDTLELAQEKPWVLMYYGNDNSSYFQRFGSEPEAMEFFKSMEVVNPFSTGVMSYNS